MREEQFNEERRILQERVAKIIEESSKSDDLEQMFINDGLTVNIEDEFFVLGLPDLEVKYKVLMNRDQKANEIFISELWANMSPKERDRFNLIFDRARKALQKQAESTMRPFTEVMAKHNYQHQQFLSKLNEQAWEAIKPTKDMFAKNLAQQSQIQNKIIEQNKESLKPIKNMLEKYTIQQSKEIQKIREQMQAYISEMLKETGIFPPNYELINPDYSSYVPILPLTDRPIRPLFDLESKTNSFAIEERFYDLRRIAEYIRELSDPRSILKVSDVIISDKENLFGTLTINIIYNGSIVVEIDSKPGKEKSIVVNILPACPIWLRDGLNNPAFLKIL